MYIYIYTHICVCALLMQFTDSGKEITQAIHDIYRSDIIREEQIKTKQMLYTNHSTFQNTKLYRLVSFF